YLPTEATKSHSKDAKNKTDGFFLAF
ncbi:hypothetical protein pipiens_018389, partial [Culex pipiens pipiens]